MTSSGLSAALEVARDHGIEAADPVVLQETNNLVAWLRPHEVVVKVGRRPGRDQALRLEHRVCTVLAARGMPVVRPIEGIAPVRHEVTGFTVTLWRRVRSDPDAMLDPRLVGRSLQAVEDALEVSALELPDFREELARAERALENDVAMAAMERSELAFLRDAWCDLRRGLASVEGIRFHALHGEPHDTNYLATAEGICWLDFESVCRGPLEWDLAFLPEEALSAFSGFHEELLALLRVVNAARLATWCWVARVPDMRRYGEHQLDLVRAWRSGR